MALLALATAITTALPDRPSDNRAAKRTLPVLLGLRRAQYLVMALHAGGLAAYLVWGDRQGLLASGPALAALLLSLGTLGTMWALKERAQPGVPAMVAFVAASIVVNLAAVTSFALASLGRRTSSVTGRPGAPRTRPSLASA